MSSLTRLMRTGAARSTTPRSTRSCASRMRPSAGRSSCRGSTATARRRQSRRVASNIPRYARGQGAAVLLTQPGLPKAQSPLRARVHTLLLAVRGGTTLFFPLYAGGTTHFPLCAAVPQVREALAGELEAKRSVTIMKRRLAKLEREEIREANLQRRAAAGAAIRKDIDQRVGRDLNARISQVPTASQEEMVQLAEQLANSLEVTTHAQRLLSSPRLLLFLLTQRPSAPSPHTARRVASRTLPAHRASCGLPHTPRTLRVVCAHHSLLTRTGVCFIAAVGVLRLGQVTRVPSWFLLFREMDEDGSGRISYAELKSMVRKSLRLSTRELPDLKLQSVWRALDEDASGFISTGEFGRCACMHACTA